MLFHRRNIIQYLRCLIPAVFSPLAVVHTYPGYSHRRFFSQLLFTMGREPAYPISTLRHITQPDSLENMPWLEAASTWADSEETTESPEEIANGPQAGFLNPDVICHPISSLVSLSSQIPVPPRELSTRLHKTNPEFICDIVKATSSTSGYLSRQLYMSSSLAWR